jgi:hypothetical protein
MWEITVPSLFYGIPYLAVTKIISTVWSLTPRPRLSDLFIKEYENNFNIREEYFDLIFLD